MFVTITEGEIDCMSVSQAQGIGNSVKTYEISQHVILLQQMMILVADSSPMG